MSTLDSKQATPHTELSGKESNLPEPSERYWPRLYAIVLGELVVLVVLFYLFTKAFE